VRSGGTNESRVGEGKQAQSVAQVDFTGDTTGVRLTHWRRVARSTQMDSKEKGVTNVLSEKCRRSDSAGDQLLLFFPRKERKYDSDGDALYPSLAEAVE